MSKLETQLAEMKVGQVIECKNAQQRALAYGFALRTGMKISARRKLKGDGYEIVRK